MKTVSASDANRHFSSLLREVAAGATVTIQSRRKPVAVMVPAQRVRGASHEARQRLLQRLRPQPASGARTWKRSDLYDAS